MSIRRGIRRALLFASLPVLLALLALSGPGCGDHNGGGGGGGGGGGTGGGEGDRLAFAHRIDDQATWQRICARPLNHAIARTEVVKFLIDLHDNNQVWFIDTERWDIHYFFARDHLARPGEPVEDHGAFNVREYRRPERRFEMGSLVHYLDSDIWTLEMVAGDNLEGPRIVRMFEQIQGQVYFGQELRFRPISPLHEASLRDVAGQLPIATSDEVFAGVRFQPLTQGSAFGTLRFVRGELDPSTVRRTEILVLEHLPDEIPVCAGIITHQLQAPLGHLAVLAATRRTPNMGLRDALTDERITALEGQMVRLEVGTQEFRVSAASQEEAERAWAASRPSQALTPRINPSDVGLRNVCDLRLDDVITAGAKASQLGEVCALGQPIVTPGGFAIPFYHYLRHLERSGAARGIAQMLEDAQFRASPEVRGQRLAELRRIIEETPLDPQLLAQVRARVASFPGSPRVIFRSSTNAEDLAGFTGAGLYRSLIASGGAGDEELSRVIRGVWASVWLQVAFEERDWYRVDHTRVAMAVLVQPFVDGAQVNGVAITANPFYEGRPGFFINSQQLGGSVTGAGGDEIPEQRLIYTYSEVIENEVLSRSSRSPDALLMNEVEIVALTEQLQMIHDHFVRGVWSSRGDQINAAEVEYLIAGEDRHVVILQARPFVVVYGQGQRWAD